VSLCRLGSCPDFYRIHVQLGRDWNRCAPILAPVLDVTYQIIEMGFVSPGEAVIVAVVLAVVPCVLLRELVNRLASMKRPRG
jgi:hypothetical protein